MIKKILLLTTIASLITGCGNLELKKSASNKLFDRRGFDGAKRQPIYNGKYIDRAKRNVIEHNYEEDSFEMDEPDEFVDPYTQNRIMYHNMVKNEKSRKRSEQRQRNSILSEQYPDIGHARDIANAEHKDDTNTELRKELSEIRAILSSTKKDLAKYKCPLQDADKENAIDIPTHKKPIKKPKPVTHDLIKHEVAQDPEEIHNDNEDILPHSDPHQKTINTSHDEKGVASHPAENQTHEPSVENHSITPKAAPVVHNESLAPAPLTPPQPTTATSPASHPSAPTSTPPVDAPVRQTTAPAPQVPTEHKMINLAPMK